MCARTIAAKIANEGKLNEFAEYGEDLIVVSDFSSTCPKCEPWGGMVLSISGTTKGYKSYEEAEEAGLFHPQCRHSWSLFIITSEGRGG